MRESIAFFDFDGTITEKDSLLEFIKFAFGRPAFYRGFLLHSPVLLAYKLKLISNHRAKEIILTHFFGGMPVSTFNEICQAFTARRMPELIRPKAMLEIEKLRKAGGRIVVVSASLEPWLQGWCEKQGLDFIATRMEVVDDRITGRILGRNCHGEEKVRRIRESFDLEHYQQIYCYGDTRGDLPMLALGTLRFYKPFR